MVDRLPRVSTTTAIGKTDLLVLYRSDFERLYAEHGDIARSLLRVLCYRYRLVYSTALDAALLSLQQRVARQLVRLAYSFGKAGVDGATIIEAVSHEDLAQIVGAQARFADAGVAVDDPFVIAGRTWTRSVSIAQVGDRLVMRSVSPVVDASLTLRGVLVRCLGAPDECEADTLTIPFHRGERLLLCSDGLTDLVGRGATATWAVAAAPDVAVLVVSPGASTVLEPTAMMYTFWYRYWYTSSNFMPVHFSGASAKCSLMAMLTCGTSFTAMLICGISLMWMLSMSSIALPPSLSVMLASGRSTITPGWTTVCTNPAAPAAPPTLADTGEPPPIPTCPTGAIPAVPPS